MLNNKKILCISSNKQIAGDLILKYANKNNLTYRELISRSDVIPELIGVYNTSFLDTQNNPNNIINLAKHFDHIVYIDLPITAYESVYDYKQTKHIIRILQDLLKITVEVIDAENS
jgi:hypothetical protein